MIRLIIDSLLATILGLMIGLTLNEREIRKENERLKEDTLQIIWVKASKEIQPQNNLVNMGLVDEEK